MSTDGELLTLHRVYRALKVLQAANSEALTTGHGSGNTTLQMAEILDRELGYTELVEALSAIGCDGCSYTVGFSVPGSRVGCSRCEAARAALQKARGQLSVLGDDTDLRTQKEG